MLILDTTSMTTTVRSLRLTAAVSRDGDWFVAQCLEVDVASQGVSHHEALKNLKEALELFFEDQPDVAVDTPVIAPVEIEIHKASA